MVLSKRDVDLALAAGYLKDGKAKESLDLTNDLLSGDPDDPLALFLTGLSFLRGDRYGLAYSLFKRSLEAKPRYETLNNLAMACIGMHRLTEAESYLHKALRRADIDKTDRCAALNNLAIIHIYNCNIGKAIEYAEESLAINPDQWDVSESLGYAHLMQGNYAKGWLGHEALINRAKARKYPVPAGIPYWMGEKVERLYVRGEQGVGDEISFASCLPDAIADTPGVVLECDVKLEGLFKRSFPQIPVYGTRKTDEREWLGEHKFDAHCLAGTLLRYYRTKASDFTGKPYLTADHERRLQWKALLSSLPGKKVGIAWTGGLGNTFRSRRSLSLEVLLPILKTPGITWVSLQYLDPTDEIEEFEKAHGIKIHHWKRAAESPDYDEQAALVMELDCVVSVTTAIAHLCGALGQKCYVLVPAKPRWFYGLSGSRLPWYGSVELFRQTADHWPMASVVAKIKPQELIAA